MRKNKYTTDVRLNNSIFCSGHYNIELKIVQITNGEEDGISFIEAPTQSI
ncbi:hypothetical protein KHA80_06415 [Anaerobacillus sp. HL2]|nr:hypothetical protein KHA80_06415 [Anaerobacillus sp. HL2]